MPAIHHQRDRGPKRGRFVCNLLAIGLVAGACAPSTSEDQLTSTETRPEKGERRTPRFLEPALGGLELAADSTDLLVLQVAGAVVDQTHLVIDDRPGPAIGDIRVQLSRESLRWQMSGAMLAGRHKVQLSTPQVKGPDLSPPIALVIAPAAEQPLRPLATDERGPASAFLAGQAVLTAQNNEQVEAITWLRYDEATPSLVIDDPLAELPQQIALSLPFSAQSLDALAVARTPTGIALLAHATSRPEALWVGEALQDQPPTITMRQLAWSPSSLGQPAEAHRWTSLGASLGRFWAYGEFRVDSERNGPPSGFWANIDAHATSAATAVLPFLSRQSGELRPLGRSIPTRGSTFSLLTATTQGDPSLISIDGKVKLWAQSNGEQAKQPLLGALAAVAIESALGEHTVLVVRADGSLQALGIDLGLGLAKALALVDPVDPLPLPLAAPPLPILLAGTPYFLIARPGLPALILRSNGAQLRLQALPFSCDKLQALHDAGGQSLHLYCLANGLVRRHLLSRLDAAMRSGTPHDPTSED